MDTGRSRTGGLIGGGILIGLGLLALLGQLVGATSVWDFLWPFIIIAFGGLFFVAMLAGGKQAGGYAIPGTIISGVGLILLFQNLTDRWETWSYGWTVILILVGLGIFISGVWSGNERQREAGKRVMKIGVILFIIFGAFFEIFFSSILPPGIQQIVFPALLILLGVYLIISRMGILPSRAQRAVDQPVDQSGDQTPPEIKPGE